MSILSVEKLCKTYPTFQLKDVSFTLEQGRIMGFIGRNGAGKTTTLKSLLNQVHPDNGTIRFFDEAFPENEFAVKQRIGFVAGGVDYYTRKKLRAISDVTRRFYEHWDDAAYQKYMHMFELDDRKTPAQLSAGMRVKYALTLALSHHAELLLLDEPTSGLDPISRDDLLDVFLNLADEGVSILFSTHITSDLDKCADDITYIKQGCIVATDERKHFVNGYRLIAVDDPKTLPQELLIGCKRSKDGYTALITAENEAKLGLPATPADLEDIMVHWEKEESL